VDADTGKAHCFMHLLVNTVECGDPMQHDSGKGSVVLKSGRKPSLQQPKTELGHLPSPDHAEGG
jgi:hypothetical protein